ncbi:MAG: XdhC/CoxI family protein [Chloroflexota bacterium]
MGTVTSDEVLMEFARLRATGVTCCLATVVRVAAPTSAKPGDKAVVTADGSMVGWIGGSCSEPSIRREAQLALQDGSPRVVRIQPESDTYLAGRSPVDGEVVLNMSCPSGGTLEIFLEPYLARPQLVVIGRSPIARTLTRLAPIVGFRSCVVHPGGEAADFPGADHIVPSLILAGAGIGTDSWVVVATMGHYDAEALQAVLGTDAAYVGLVASRRRRNAVAQELRKRGWPGDALSGIVNPAGRTLADAPEEIALSILADIVDRRNRRQKRMTPAPEPDVVAFATDPVCGMAVEISGALFHTDDVYFCCMGCQEAYEVNRERYVVAR